MSSSDDPGPLPLPGPERRTSLSGPHLLAARSLVCVELSRALRAQLPHPRERARAYRDPVQWSYAVANRDDRAFGDVGTLYGAQCRITLQIELGPVAYDTVRIRLHREIHPRADARAYRPLGPITLIVRNGAIQEARFGPSPDAAVLTPAQWQPLTAAEAIVEFLLGQATPVSRTRPFARFLGRITQRLRRTG